MPRSIWQKIGLYPLEMWLWCGGLVALYFLPPASEGHFSFCIFRLMGFHYCPGCGLGSSIHALLHGQWLNSWQYHWLGIPALLILLQRIYRLATKNKSYGQLDDEFSGSSTR